MRTEKKRLGEMLVEAGVIDVMQLNSALGQQKQWGGRLGSVLIQMGFVDEQKVCSILERQMGEKCLSLEGKDIPQKALNAVKLDVAKKYCIMPLDIDKNTLTVATADPTDVRTLDELRFIIGARIRPVLAIESDIKKAIAEHYEGITVAGKTHKVVIEKEPEDFQSLMTESSFQFTEQTSEQAQMEHGTTFSPEELVEKQIEKLTEIKDAVAYNVVEALTAILIEKGIITKAELSKKIKEKAKKT